MPLANLTDAQKRLIEGHDLGLKRAGVNAILDDLISAVLLRCRVARVAGTNAAVINGLSDVASVVAILAFTTSTGAPATKCLLDVTTDYTVADGKVTTVGDKSAATLLIVYVPTA